MLSVYIIGAIVLAVTLGYVTGINTGLFAISFAYIIGCFFMDLKAGEIIRMWPVGIFFVITSVSLFYNFALANGTLEKLALHLLYRCRRFPQILPFAIFFAALLIAGLGAGFFTVMAFFSAITLMLCDKIGMNKLVGAVAVNCGALVGANFMTSGSGIIFKGLMEASGYGEKAFEYTFAIFAVTLIFSVCFITAFLLLFGKTGKVQELANMEKPERFDDRQKLNLVLIVLMVVVILSAPIAHLLFPSNEFIRMVNSKMDVGLVAIVMSAVALMLKLADQKEVIAKVPWNTLIMICGVGMLIAVAIKAGTITLLSGWIGDNIPVLFVPVMFGLVGAFMSFFSSTLGVVAPALFPLVPVIASGSNISPMLLFVCIIVGAQASAISPFSSGGSLLLGSCSSEDERAALFPQLLFVAVPSSVIFALVVCFAVSIIV